MSASAGEGGYEMSVRQRELENTPIFAELTAEVDLEQLLDDATEPDKGADQRE